MKFYKIGHLVTNEDIKKFNYENQKVGVIVHIEDKNGNILLQQRGVKSRDENGLFEDVGGRVEDNDINFKEAIIREMKEEMGEDAIVTLKDETDIYHVFKGDTNWIFVIFKGVYQGGDIHIMEPEKCLGYKFFSYDEALESSLVTPCCKYLIEAVEKSK